MRIGAMREDNDDEDDLFSFCKLFMCIKTERERDNSHY